MRKRHLPVPVLVSVRMIVGIERATTPDRLSDSVWLHISVDKASVVVVPSPNDLIPQ
jgi:hypothetical protein